MSELYLMFPTPVVRVSATTENYDPVQLEIQAAMKRIEETQDSTSVSYLYKGTKETAISQKTYDFIDKYNCENLKNRIYEAVTEYANKIGWQGPKKFQIRQSWINIADLGDQHGHHCHPGYAISGCYYFRVSKEQGPISFNNPNSTMLFCQFPQGPACPQTTDVVPDDGDIVLFPSWLMHTTRPNKTKEQRVSIAFNIDYVGGTDIIFGLAKESHIPYHKIEHSLRDIGKIQ